MYFYIDYDFASLTNLCNVYCFFFPYKCLCLFILGEKSLEMRSGEGRRAKVYIELLKDFLFWPIYYAALHS